MGRKKRIRRIVEMWTISTTSRPQYYIVGHTSVFSSVMRSIKFLLNQVLDNLCTRCVHLLLDGVTCPPFPLRLSSPSTVTGNLSRVSCVRDDDDLSTVCVRRDTRGTSVVATIFGVIGRRQHRLRITEERAEERRGQ